MPHRHRHDDGCCGEPSPDRIGNALLKMKEKGMRITGPRKAMIEALASATRPLSVEEIHAKAGDGALDLVTIYRSLSALDEAGIVQRHPLERGRSLYALVAPNHHHHHVICRRCGRIERLPGCDNARIESAAKSKGYSDLTHIMEIYGICPQCSAQSSHA